MDEINTKHLEDFILDDSFKEYVIGENPESVRKWQLWNDENPQRANEFEIAKKVMKLLLKTNKHIPQLNTEKDLEELLSAIREEKTPVQMEPSASFPWLKLTGMLALLITMGTMAYFLVRNSTSEEVVYNEVIVPLGEKTQLILSDGTHIWINSSSKLRYPASFNKKERTVYLEGEAFFDVTKKEKQLFVVNTPDLKVKVLGTAFNIKNYPGDKHAVTTVVRGKVSVENKKEKQQPVFLEPNENMVINTLENPTENNDKTVAKENQTPAHLQPIVNKQVNVEAITSWKDQMLVFSDEPLEEVILKMERWYNVKIHILDEDLKKERYRGKFVNNETIYQVFEAIKFTTPINYKLKNNEFFIYKPK